MYVYMAIYLRRQSIQLPPLILVLIIGPVVTTTIFNPIIVTNRGQTTYTFPSSNTMRVRGLLYMVVS